ncbi:MAG TPA: tetratricopeptide repeat protein [Caldilineaceae bacterium]|nr:tetratricopeptide repeat protein [Caldilineaceae bacterium]
MTISKTKLDAWLNGVIEAGWLAALVVAPLFFNVFSSRVFEPDKISLIRSIALVMLLAWLIKLANGGQPWLPAFRTAPPAAPSGEEPPAAPLGLWADLRRTPLLIPILLLIAAYLLSTTFSVARFVSWWGSYQRLQGTYTFLSYVTIALLTAAHLRSPAQIRRLQHAIVLTSLPIAIYGVIQHYRIDPLPWGGDVTTRVAANAGNAIFLAAYLIMAFFFTLERVYSSFAYLLGYKPAHHVDSQDMPTALAGGAYLFVLLVQLLAIFWTQSRGPWMGLLFGLYLFVLLLFTALRPKHHRLWTLAWIGLGATGALLLVLMNTTSLFAGLADVPYVGRLTTMLESESGTGRVRVLIWQGAAEMVFPHEPLTHPDGSEDPYNALRPLIGYGPEAMWIAYNPFYPPELAQYEARNASPDRSHNETWDALVITGILGFLAYFTLFIAIFYWALRWLGLLINRQDALLFGVSLALASAVLVVVFYVYDSGWRFLGVALPAGLILGLGAYVTLSAFLHSELSWNRADLPRQLLIITILATLTAHFIEIHFGIAIAATRTYFWIQTALLMVLGMGWAHPSAYAIAQEVEEEEQVEEQPARDQGKGKKRGRAGRASVRRVPVYPPALPATVMTDALVFITLVFTYTTNSQGLTSALDVLFASVLERSTGGSVVSSPAIFFLLLFTWLVAAVIGLSAESLQHRRTPGGGWWLRGLGLHALVVWGAWLLYGAYQGGRLVQGAGGSTLDEQLAHVAGHFAIYTWLIVLWLLASGAVYAWPHLRDRRLPDAGRAALAAAGGVVLAVLIFIAISRVNIALVRADIIYKQGQQFDNQGNWLTSIELYRRALNARRTEDHYMLFLGRALLEQAKQVQEPEGAYQLPENASLNHVLSLTTEQVSQMGRQDLLRAAEIVLLEAQRVNPLNTDHTANLARLYRSWSDLSPENPELRQAMLDRSIAMYERAVQLSPNAAHLWNEKGNAHLARGEDDQAEAAYLHSLSLDPKYDQTYLLLADFYERRERYAEEIELLEQGLANLPNRPQLWSYLGVAQARTGDLEGAIASNQRVVELQPNNTGAMRNLAILYRDQGNAEEAIAWVERAIAVVGNSDLNQMNDLRRLAAELYQAAGQLDIAIGHLEQARQADPNDIGTLNRLYTLYAATENWPAAADVLRALAALEPDNYEHPLALAQVMQQMGQEADALTYANQALALAPVEERPVITALITRLNGG